MTQHDTHARRHARVDSSSVLESLQVFISADACADDDGRSEIEAFAREINRTDASAADALQFINRKRMTVNAAQQLETRASIR